MSFKEVVKLISATTASTFVEELMKEFKGERQERTWFNRLSLKEKAELTEKQKNFLAEEICTFIIKCVISVSSNLNAAQRTNLKKQIIDKL